MPSPSDPFAIELGPIDLRWYAIFVLAGILGGIWVAAWIAKDRGQDETFLLDSAPIVIAAAVLGARTYYVLLEWRYFVDHPDKIVGLQLRGLTIHGALAGGILCFWWLCRRRNQSFLRWADTIVIGVAIGQALGRCGNWANQEAFGRPTDLPWGLEIDPENRPAEYAASDRFHPTFLYESLCSLIIAAALAIVLFRYGSHSRWRDGYVLALYLILYGVVRLGVESLRTDSLNIGPWPAAYWLSLGLILSGVALAFTRYRGVNGDI